MIFILWDAVPVEIHVLTFWGCAPRISVLFFLQGVVPEEIHVPTFGGVPRAFL